jgi:DNA-binding transcriptional regulator YdaS (Cro superfamily)
MNKTVNNLTFSDSMLIDLLGGTGKVAKMCKVAPAAVAQWRLRGLPHGQLIFLAARLEQESHGLVTRKDLFPKTYLLVWPELQKKNT